MRATSLQQAIVSTKQALDPRRLATLDDAELLQRLIAAEPAALEAIMHRHGSTVMSASRQILKDAADVEDVFQATFIVLLKSAPKIQQGRSLGSWLFGVAHRLAVHARCRNTKQRTREQSQAELPDAAAPTDDLSWREATALLHEELNRMPDRLRVPLLMCHLEGKSRDEAAAELGVSVGAVKGLLERGRAKLKVRLEKRGIAFSVGLLGVLAVDGGQPPPAWLDSTLQAVLGHAARPTVQQLAQGVLPMSKVIKMMLAASVVLVACVFGVVTYMNAGSETETPVVPKKDSPPPSKPDTPTKADMFTVSGKVVGPDGKPVAGAILYVPALLKDPPQSEADIGIKEVTQSAADGTFRAEIQRTIVSRFLYAKTNQHSLAWLEMDEGKDRTDVTLKLEKELPINVRVLDTEGKPVVGAKIRLQGIKRAQEGNLDGLLEEYKRDWQHALQRNMTPILAPFGNIEVTPTTDKEGRFTLRGVPSECVVMVAVESESIGKTMIHVVTREGFDPKPYNEAAMNQVPEALRLFGQPATLHGVKTDIIMPLGRLIEGTVTDAKTGKPIAGITVGTGDHYSGHITATTDAQGRYRLVGVRKQKQYLVHVHGRQLEARYMAANGRIDDTEGYGPIKYDIRLAEGVVVTGKLIDRATGQGVYGFFRAAPLANNEFYNKDKSYQAYASSRASTEGNDDGTFRLLMIPGPNVLLVQAPGNKQPSRSTIRPYLPAKPDPEHATLFTKNGDDYFISTAGNAMEFLRLNQAIKVIDIPADAKEFKVDLYVERGQTATINVVDGEGKPVSKNVVSGAAAHFPFVNPIEESTFTALAIDPDQPRLLVVVNASRRLAGSVLLAGNEKGPITVKLEPLGTATGQLLDQDGQPRAGVVVNPRGRDQAINDLYRDAFGLAIEATTDAQGKFTLPIVLPNIEVYLGLRKGKEYYVGEKAIGSRKVEPSKSVDFGTIRTKVAQ